MREFKFRAWNKKNKYMSMIDGSNDIGDLLLTNDGVREVVEDCCCGESFYENVLNTDYEIMQFTGLLDKNGKEIFEGDIYQWRGFEVSLGKQIRPIRTAIVSSDNFIDDVYRLKNLVLGNGTVEIIGNRFENPELLKEVS